MQVVINMFLSLYGWRSDGPLTVFASLSNWSEEENRTFNVTVQIRNPEVLMSPQEPVVPACDGIQKTGQALAWVLWALFAYSVELNLGRVEFW